MSEQPRVYLAGPINACTVDEAAGWRERWAARLVELGYTYLDPFEAKHVLREAGVTETDLDGHAIRLGFITANQIVKNSLAMTEASDIVVLNFLDCKKNNVPTIGTPCELIFATMWQELQDKPRKHTIILANDIKSSFFSLGHVILDSEEALFVYLADLKAQKQAA